MEELAIDTLTHELANPEQINRYARAWLEGRHQEAAKDIAKRAKIETRLKANGKELERITAMMIKGIGDEKALDAASKELGVERDRLQAELAKEPLASNVVVHPAAVVRFAESLSESRNYLRSGRAKLSMTLHMLHDRGELHQLIREVVESIVLSRDDDGRMSALITTWLDNFTVEGGQPRVDDLARRLVAFPGQEFIEILLKSRATGCNGEAECFKPEELIVVQVGHAMSPCCEMRRRSQRTGAGIGGRSA